jgi:hypothetical protein
MGFRRLLLALVVCGAVWGAFSGRALAAVPPPSCGSLPSMPQSFSNLHFAVYYDGDPTKTDYITETQAGDIVGIADQAYSAYLAWGYPAPLTGASGKTEFYVYDLSPWHLASIDCGGAIYFDAGTVASAGEAVSIAWDVFSEIEDGRWSPLVEPSADVWLNQGAAEWAAALSLNYPSFALGDLGPAEISLDCWDDAGTSKCSKNGYENLGLSRWTFYEYLAERFGRTFMLEVLNDANAAGSAYTGLSNALNAHGTTVPDAYNDWVRTDMTGGYTAGPLQGLVPTTYTRVQTGTKAGPVFQTQTQAGPVASSIQVPVDHLATRYVEFDRGDGSTSSTCYAATLAVTVTIPAGTLSKPNFFWTGTGGSAVPLSISGSTATASVPWDTCTWSKGVGLLSLPNASSAVNGANFVVSATLSVDLTKPVATAVPPDPVSVNTPVVPVDSVSLAPTISVFGPELITLSAASRQLRLIVESNGEGQLQAAVGSISLGNATLRPGNNDVRFTLPASLFASFRTAALTNVLTLTPVSSNGSATGQPVTRTLGFAPAAKPTAVAKAKAKKKKH